MHYRHHTGQLIYEATQRTCIKVHAAGQGNISKSAFVRSAYREVSCALQRGIGQQYARSTQNLARAAGRHFMPGCAVPVQEEAFL